MTRSLAPVSAARGARTRIAVATVSAVLTLALAVTAGLLAPADGGAPVIFVDRVSSAISGVAAGAGTSVWWVYAFLLGVVAGFNPCGFALLPAYLGLYLNDGKAGESVAARARRSLAVSLVVAGTFTALFGAAGAVFSAGSWFIVRSLPWAGLGVGVLLIVAGGVSLAGGAIGSSVPERMASKLGPTARRARIRGYAAFGLAYGLASLGCALPLFLALLGIALAAGGPWNALVAFALYGAGMAAVLAALSLAAGLVSVGVLAGARGVGRFVPGASSALLLASGAYVVFYWLTTGRLLFA